MASCATARLVARTNATHASVIFNSSCVHVPDACERFLVRSITDGTLHRCRRSSKKDKCTLGEACEESVSREALAFDIGFFNGDDTALLLMQGYKVVAIEANAELVEQGRRRFAAALRNGQLVLLHRALAWSAETEGVVRPFYVNRHNQQWSSFHKAVGCRPASWPATQPTMSAAVGPDCDERPVRGESCMALFATYGTPLLLKLDIEGSEGPCIDALLQGTRRPSYLVMETMPHSRAVGVYAKLHALGYESFKWVDQTRLKGAGWGETSGPFGEGARDCHLGYAWRSLPSLLRWHRAAEALKRDGSSAVAVPADAAGCRKATWADVHARHRLVRRQFEPWGELPPRGTAARWTYQSPGFWSEVEAAGRRPAKRPLEEETAVEGASGEQRRSRLAGFGAFLLDTARSLRRGGGWGR